MERLFEALRPLIRFVVRRPLVVVAVAVVLTVLGLLSAVRLQIDTDLANLLPSDYESVQALERLRATVGSESPIEIGIESPSFEANQAFAEALIPEMMELRAPSGGPLFTRYRYRQDPTFLEENALYFATDEELGQLEGFLQAQIEDARLEANPFYFDLDEDLGVEDEAEEPSTDDLVQSLESLQVQEYMVSEDSTVLALQFLPTGAQTNIGFIRYTYARVDSLLAAMQPAQFHPQMQATAAGRLYRQLIEIQSVTRDVQTSFGAGISAVLLFVVVYFLYKALQVRGVSRRTVLSEVARMPLTAFLLGVPLLMSLAWTFGIAQVAFGTLNLMTSTLALVLFGLGIDYGIHYYARYTEERGRGRVITEAAEVAFVSTGQAIAVSAATTAAALFCLTIADFRGFSEFGLIGGLGILFALAAMVLVLPALLVLAERLRLLNLEVHLPEPVFHVQRKPFPAARPLIVGSLIVVVASLFLLPAERFEYNFDTFEPSLEEYRERQAHIRPAIPFTARRNPAYLVVDSEEDALAVAQELRRRAENDTLILAVESLQERFPSTPEAAQRRLEQVAAIRELTEDPFLSQDPSGQVDRIRRAASTTAPIPLEAVPEDLKRQFMDKEGRVGRFVIVYPAVSLSEDARLSMAFAERIGEVTAPSGKTYYAGSTSIVAADMLRLLLAESPLMVGLTVVIIVLLMGLAFRSAKWTLLALLPLLVGVLWMLGLMVLLKVPFSFYNIVVLPAVLGIGEDAGVHIVHRYREEGLGSIRHVLRSTGEHVTMGGLTTMIGFGGLLLSFHPGLRSIGMLAVIGIGSTLLAALLFLPALLQWLEDRGIVEPEGTAQATS